MNDNRHPAGTSLGGQWAPGEAAEIDETEFSDAADPEETGLDATVDEALDAAATPEEKASANQARECLEGRGPQPGESYDLREAKNILHSSKLGLRGPARERVDSALTRLYRADHPDPGKGVGRIVGRNDECREAERFLAGNRRYTEDFEASKKTLNDLASKYPGMRDIELSTEGSTPDPTGVYHDERGAQRLLSDEDRESTRANLAAAGFDSRFFYGQGIEYAGNSLSRVNIGSFTARRGVETKEATDADLHPSQRGLDRARSAFALRGNKYLTVEKGLSGQSVVWSFDNEEKP